MNLNMYTILDSATGAYTRPFFMQSDGQATRAFKDHASDGESDVGRHPEDYSLHRIGVFNDNTAKITPEDRECLATALEVLAIDRQNVKRADQEKLLESVPQPANAGRQPQ